MNLLQVNLETKMVESKKKTIKSIEIQVKHQDALLLSVNHLLEKDQAGDLKLLEEAGFGKAINNAITISGEKNKIVNIKEKITTNERIFSINEIKDIAVNYGLRFLPSDVFKGEMCPELPTKIREFKSLNLNVEKQSTYSWNYRSEIIEQYFILAPKSSFELKEKPKDPLLFAKLTDGTYYLIHKWGNDLSLWNYITNIPMRSGFNFNMTVFLSIILLESILYIIDIGFFLSSIGCLAILLFAILLHISDSDDAKISNQHYWNKQFKD